MSSYFRSRVTNQENTNISIEVENASTRVGGDGTFRLPVSSEYTDDVQSGSVRYNDVIGTLELKSAMGWRSVNTFNPEDLVTKPELDYRLGNLSKVSWTGDYNDLNNKPTSIFDFDVPSIDTDLPAFLYYNGSELSWNNISISYNDITNKPNLSTVAITGDYNDLINKPSGGGNANIVAGTGITYNPTSGLLSIGQSVETSADVTFKTVTADEFISTSTGVPTFRSATNIVLSPEGEVVVEAPISLKSYTTSELGDLVVAPGTVAYDSSIGNLRVWNGTTWTSGNSGGTSSGVVVSFVYEQTIASDVWLISHNLGQRFLNIEVIKSDGTSWSGKFDHPTVEFLDQNTCRLTFSSPNTGYASITSGGVADDFISKAELKELVANSVDFADFKAKIAAL